LIEEKAREINRIQKVLEGANIKLASVISDVSGKTGVSILKAIISGTTDVVELSNLAKGRTIKNIPLLQRALKGCVGEHQRQMLNHQIRHIEFLNQEIERIDSEIQKKTEYAAKEIELIDTVPGIGLRSAQRIIAEIGVDMAQFRSAAHLASWAGLVPECKESAGKKKSTKIRKGNKALKTTLVECACSAIRDKNSFFYARYKKISSRRGGKRALVAIAHSMLLSIYSMIKKNEPFRDLGSDYFFVMDKEKILNRNLQSIKKLGYSVTLQNAG
jgi:DNA uptake protein ComE-like DNA-binding protein